tara:strand:- start:6646 stop:6897 length:252 start_codon:yes stop_codon:yes gene_type:complete
MDIIDAWLAAMGACHHLCLIFQSLHQKGHTVPITDISTIDMRVLPILLGCGDPHAFSSKKEQPVRCTVDPDFSGVATAGQFDR